MSYNSDLTIEKIWQEIVQEYQKVSRRSSIWQIVNSVIPFLIIWYLMYLSLEVSYWLTIALAVIAAGFLTRIFIIFHDCGHGAFFESRRANNFWGYLTGILTFAPFHQWRHDHAVHHATSGDLDRRGVGDIWTMTVKEYREASYLTKLGYRLYRNPLVLFGVGGFYLFVIRHRFPSRGASKRERLSVYWTNVALVSVILTVCLAVGVINFILVHAPILLIAMAGGVWLFYVQHQFEDMQWDGSDNWDYFTAALYGSSFYKLPRVLQWFTGNIGFHHVHHLSPRIPNYNLERCHNEIARFSQIKPVTLRSSLSAMRYRLWDEEERRLVSYRQAKCSIS